MTTVLAAPAPLGGLAPLREPGLDPGAVLDRIPAVAADVRSELVASGMPSSVDTADLVTLPYPTKFGLWRAARTPAPFLSITNRLLVIRWHDGDGRLRTMLWEPSDVAAGQATPYFQALRGRKPAALADRFFQRHGDVLGHLHTLGIDPAEIDFLAFDHLHTQDVRRWIGTADGGVAPAFPNARLLVQRAELDALDHLHPQQRPWYQADTYRDVRRDAILAVDGDVLVGSGVALISTPGHVTGNQSLALRTTTGIWVSSENAIAVECLAPQHSKIPGLARWARRWGQDVVVNANTIEAIADQYNSLVLERTLADPCPDDERFRQFFPSSELTARWTNPGTAPTFTHGAITHRSTP